MLHPRSWSAAFDTFRYWLEQSDHLVEADFEPYRVELIGKYSTELAMQDRVSRFWLFVSGQVG